MLGQDPILTALRHQLLRDQVHHSWFFQGEPGVGKLETALWFAQGYFCQQRQSISSSSSEISCGQCQNCLAIEFYHHPQVLFLTVGNRIPVLAYWQRTLLNLFREQEKQEVEEKNPFLLRQIGREISQLIARHRQRLLEPVAREKTTYQEGIKLNAEDLEKLIHDVYLQYGDLLRPQEIYKSPPALSKKKFLEDMRKLQNSLDRSVLTKENLDRVMNWCKHNGGRKKLVIIESIEKINSTVVGLFLKILEDPPPQVSFILITEDMDNLNQEVTAPLLSRCLHFPFASLKGHLDEILKKKFKIETGFINLESNFKIFFQKNLAYKNLSALDFLLQPIYRIIPETQNKHFSEEELVSELYLLMENYSLNTGQPTKINYRQALSILRFLNQNHPLIKKNNYNKTHFMVELSLFIKKILKIPTSQA